MNIHLDDEEFALTRDAALEEMAEVESISRRASQAQAHAMAGIIVLSELASTDSLTGFIKHLSEFAATLTGERNGAIS